MTLSRCLWTLAVASSLIGPAVGYQKSALAQSYPTRTVKIVVPFPAGGPLDFTARLLAEKLSDSLKQPFIVENRPGGAGNIGTEAVAKADPDGYTLLLVLDTALTVNPALYKNLKFDPDLDLVPITIVAGFYQMLVVHPSVPVNSVAEFVTFAKQKSVTYGSGGGKGNPGHLTMEYFRVQAGLDLVHVPYKGNPQVVTDLVAGHVQAGFVATPGVVQLAKDGKLKGLAVSGSRRTPLAPDVPTMAESGYRDFAIGFYQVMLAPKGIPESIRKALEREVRQALRIPEIEERLRSQDLELIANSGLEARALLHAVTEKWRQLIQVANIKLD